jgi:hypothetical protein
MHTSRLMSPARCQNPVQKKVKANMKSLTAVTLFALAAPFMLGQASAATKIDLSYKGNPCEKCWIKTTNNRNGQNASANASKAYFHSEGEAHARAEFRFDTRIVDNHSFVGKVKPVYWGNGAKDISVFQIYSEESGKPVIMLGINAQGKFYNEIGGAQCQNGISAKVGTTYKVSAVFESSDGTATVWVNDKKCTSVGKNSGAGQFYIKIGAYRTNSGAGTATMYWSDFSIKRIGD